MKPIEEEDRLRNIDNSNSNKKKPYQYLQKVKLARRYSSPRFPYRLIRPLTPPVDYEIYNGYNGNEKDKVNCP